MLRRDLVKLCTASCVPPNLHSGKSPVLPLLKCLPRNQPSPKSSSRSINSIRSPLAKLNSSALRAENSSAEHQLLVYRVSSSRGRRSVGAQSLGLGLISAAGPSHRTRPRQTN